jgi:hypothetical protein
MRVGLRHIVAACPAVSGRAHGRRSLEMQSRMDGKGFTFEYPST